MMNLYAHQLEGIKFLVARSGAMLDTSRWKQPAPLKHQLVGVQALLRNKAFYLADEPRTGKSRQVVDAACMLREMNLIDLVVVVARVSGRGVWGNAKIGQVKRWSWLPVRVFEYHQNQHDLWSDANPQLTWVVTNYDFVRSDKRLSEFLGRLSNYKSIMLVFDESQKLGNEHSLQSKAAMKICWSKQELRDQNGKVARINWQPRVLRRVMLSGTPGGPLKQWSQFNILDHVFDRRFKSVISFKWRFAEYGDPVLRPIPGRNGKKGGLKTVHPQVGWKNLDKLSKITAPYCLMRKRKDCEGLRDVPVDAAFAEVRLSKETWKLYQSLKRDAIVQLSTGELYVSPNKGVCLMRLAQVASGHLGGFEEFEPVRWLSNEKVDWLAEELKEECLSQNILVWCRWVAERKQVAERLKNDGFTVYQIHGGQNKSQRRMMEMIFAEDAQRATNRCVLVAQPQAGGDSLDMSAASDVYRMSSDFNWETFSQSNQRPLGPAQQAAVVRSTDVVACGPDGQRTIEHTILEAREENRILEKMTCEWWKKELEDDK